MIEKVIAWWKGLKWYYKWPAAIGVLALLILLIVERVLSKCSAGSLNPGQTAALDDLQKKQVDATLKQKHAKVEASEKETKKHDADVKAHEEKLKEIANKAREDDAEVRNQSGMSISEINAWRKRQGR